MKIVFWIVVLIWSYRIFRNLLAYIRLWFVKEYRSDRMIIHLKTAQGRQLLVIPWQLPPLTPKTLALFLFSGLTLILEFYFLPVQILLRMIFLDLSTFPITWIFTLALQIPTTLYHVFKISRARILLAFHKKMKVIGITGSYGKTSTKEYLAAILQSKFKVLKTEASKNSPIGIAEVVLSQLKPDHEVFIVEMGAYKKGEIAKMTKMVKPAIAILTAINAQHQDLFGSMENTMKAKYELVEGLRGEKLVIVNQDNSCLRQMAEWAKNDGNTVWFYTKNSKNEDQSKDIFVASKIITTLNGTSFRVSYKKDRASVKTQVLGEHQVSNILASIAAAVACGMTLAEACKAANFIVPVKKVLQKIAGANGVIYIDDTFNNNPDAAIAVLKFLAKAKGKKILVFQPMIELGEYANSAHEEVGEFAGKICDEIILTNRNFFESFQKGVAKPNKNKTAVVLSPQAASDLIRNQTKKGDMVVFKGKEAENALNLLTT